MENRSLVTIAEHSREKILYMLEMAKEFEAHPNRHILAWAHSPLSLAMQASQWRKI